MSKLEVAREIGEFSTVQGFGVGGLGLRSLRLLSHLSLQVSLWCFGNWLLRPYKIFALLLQFKPFMGGSQN